MNKYEYESGDRILRQKQYLEIKKAIEQIARASQDLSKGVKALEDAYSSCCIHAPAPQPAPGPRRVPEKERAS